MSAFHSTQSHSPDEPIDILLVEDNPADARLTQEAFEETDGETELQVVTRGDEAIGFLTQAAGDESASLPDLVLLDLNLPAGDGCEVLEAVRDDPQLQCLPVLVLTSSAAREDVIRCYEAAANAYLTKPASIDEFSSMVETVHRFWFSIVKLPPAQS